MLSLALRLTLLLGIHKDTSPTRLHRQFRACWGKTEVFVNHHCVHELARERIWQHQATWTLTLSCAQVFPFGLRLETTLSSHYGDLAQTRRSHTAFWHETKSARHGFRSSYWLTQSLHANQPLRYAVTDTNPVQGRLTTGWALLADPRLQTLHTTPQLGWQGRLLRLIATTVSADEDSPFWLAQLQLADLSDFARLAIGDALQLALGQEVFALMVDGKSLSRESQASVRYEISAISPLALLETPYAALQRFDLRDATQSVEAVTALIGPVQWQLPHWVIPAGHLQLESVTPLQAARTIVEAIGGIIESQPDGTVVCRKRHPVSLPDYAQATNAHALLDSDVITAWNRLVPHRGYNRVTLANENGGREAHDDRLEFVTDEGAPHQGTVRAYLGPLRPVTLAHSGNPATSITPLGEVVRLETEVVEFIEGNARTHYQIRQIVSDRWQHADLGALHVSGAALTASIAGYSLLLLTYLTASVNWKVTLVADEEVQFFLIDV